MYYRCKCSFFGIEIPDGFKRVNYKIEFGTYWKLICENRAYKERSTYIMLGDDGVVIILEEHQLNNFEKVERDESCNMSHENMEEYMKNNAPIEENKKWTLYDAKIDYKKEHSKRKSCGNCGFCCEYLGSNNYPFFVLCDVSNKISLFNKAKKCKYYNNRCL